MTFQNVSSLKDFKCVHPTIGALCTQYVKETNNEGKTAVTDLLASECFNVVADVPAHTALKISTEIAQAIQNHDYANQSADVFDLLNCAFWEYVPDYRDEFTQDYLKTCVFNSAVIDAVQAQLINIVGCVKYKQDLINILQKIRALKSATKKNLIKDRIKQGATILAKLTDVAEIQSSQLIDSYTRACIEFSSLHDITALEVITLVQDAVIDAHVDALPQYAKHQSSKKENDYPVRPLYGRPLKSREDAGAYILAQIKEKIMRGAVKASGVNMPFLENFISGDFVGMSEDEKHCLAVYVFDKFYN